MGKIDIKIKGKNKNLTYDYDVDDYTVQGLSEAIAYLELIKVDLLEELRQISEKYNISENK